MRQPRSSTVIHRGYYKFLNLIEVSGKVSFGLNLARMEVVNLKNSAQVWNIISRPWRWCTLLLQNKSRLILNRVLWEKVPLQYGLMEEGGRRQAHIPAFHGHLLTMLAWRETCTILASSWQYACVSEVLMQPGWGDAIFAEDFDKWQVHCEVWALFSRRESLKTSFLLQLWFLVSGEFASLRLVGIFISLPGVFSLVALKGFFKGWGWQEAKELSTIRDFNF